MRLNEVAKAVNGKLVGEDVVITGVSTDTRALQKGDLFVALRGPHFDGHQFLNEALLSKAVGALIDQSTETDLSTVHVLDAKKALGQLAAHWRAKFDIPVIGVTGSNGKTTVKEMIGAILSVKSETLVTVENLNNEIGVPLTLLRLRDAHRYAVIEMGTNHIGEIRHLSRITHPTVALITNAAPAHLEGLRNMEIVAEAKAEIFDGLDDNGVAVINADDPFASFWRQRAAPRRCLSFALHHDADVTAEYTLEANAVRLQVCTAQGDVDVLLSLPGMHNVANALAAICAVLAVGVDLEQVKNGLETITPIAGRLQKRRGTRGATVYDDTYNANPASIRVAIDVLSPNTGPKLLVLGDMAELGEQQLALHHEIGLYARECGIDAIYALGPLSEETVRAFGKGAVHFKTRGALIKRLSDELSKDTTVLVKGSRFMHMEGIVSAVVEENDDPSGGSIH